MKINIYAIYDAKAEVFGKPIFFNTDGLAVRSFYEACDHPESEFKKYPHDYSLHKIGEYEDTTSEVTNKMPVQIATALEAIKTTEE
jgi:hypothetical protein